MAENIEGFDFSLSDVSQHCEAVRIGQDVELSCSQELWPVEYLCEVDLVSATGAYVDCIGTELLDVEANCDVLFDDEDIGDLLC